MVGAVLLIAASATALAAFSPWTAAESASMLGIGERQTLTVERVEQIRPDALTRGWNCPHWEAHGQVNGKPMMTRACHDQAPTPRPGDELEVTVAALSSEAYLNARPSSPVRWVLFVAFCAVALYGLAAGIRLLGLAIRARRSS